MLTEREHGHNMMELALAITTSWPVYSGASTALLERAREERDDDLEERVGNAIELAILGQAKRFTKSSACQKVIDGIWRLKKRPFASVHHSQRYVAEKLSIKLTAAGPYCPMYENALPIDNAI